MGDVAMIPSLKMLPFAFFFSSACRGRLLHAFFDFNNDQANVRHIDFLLRRRLLSCDDTHTRERKQQDDASDFSARDDLVMIVLSI